MKTRLICPGCIDIEDAVRDAVRPLQRQDGATGKGTCRECGTRIFVVLLPAIDN